MKLIKELTDKEITGEEANLRNKDFRERIAVRSVLINDENKIALISSPKSKFGLHKLPGGGLEESEELEQTLKREIIEETGCNIKIKREVGKIIEFKNKYEQKQISYCYIAEVDGEIGEPSFTEEEKIAGYNVIWVDLDEAIEIIKKDNPDDYTAKFIVLRDYYFLIEARKLLEK